MAKGRMLNREIGMSMKFQELQSDTSRLFATWTIPHLDKNGVFYGDPQSARSAVFPMREDISNAHVESFMRDMERVGLIVRFKAAGRVWQVWPGFAHNQTYLRKDLERTSFPPPPKDSVDPDSDLRNNSVDVTGNIPPNGIEEKGIEEKGMPPPSATKKVARSVGFSAVFTEHTDERIGAYLSIVKPEISAGNIELVLKRIPEKYLGVWKDALTLWALKGYNPTGFADLFDRFDVLCNQAKAKQNGHAKNAPVLSDSQYAELTAKMEAPL